MTDRLTAEAQAALDAVRDADHIKLPTEEFNEGWEEGRHSADVEVMQLRAEIERLKADPDPGQRIWDDGYAAGKAASATENERLRALVLEAARLLEGQSAPASADRMRAALEPYPNET